MVPSPPAGGSINWEPLRQRLVGHSDDDDDDDSLEDSLAAAHELIARLDTVPSSEFPLMLSALLPAFSSVLAHKTKPTAGAATTTGSATNSSSSNNHLLLRQAALEWMGKLPSNNEALRPHAPHLVAVAMDVLTRDYEDNAVAASRILFDLYKTYRTLPPDYVQPYLDFVASLYRGLQGAVVRNFSREVLLGSTGAVVAATTATTTTPAAAPTSEPQAAAPREDADAMDVDKEEEATPMDVDKVDEKRSVEDVAAKPAVSGEGASTLAAVAPESAETATTTAATPSATVEETSTRANATTPRSSPTTGSLLAPEQSPQKISLKSNLSFRVLTECPLIVVRHCSGRVFGSLLHATLY